MGRYEVRCPGDSRRLRRHRSRVVAISVLHPGSFVVNEDGDHDDHRQEVADTARYERTLERPRRF